MTLILLLILAAVVIGELARYLIGKYRAKYRWKCKQCGFEIKSNSWETYNISKTSHNHVSTQEYKR